MAKIGKAIHLFVTILSILSEVVSLLAVTFFITQYLIIDSMYLYRSAVIIDSESSSSFFSHSLMSFSI